MKNNLLLAAFLAATCALPAYAAPTAGGISNVKLALTLKVSYPGSFERGPDGEFIEAPVTGERIPDFQNQWTVVKGDKTMAYEETVIKSRSFKYGNRELLQDLLDADILPGDSITGWAVKAVTFGPSPEISFNLVKKGQPPVYLAELISLKPFYESQNSPPIASQTSNTLLTVTTVGAGDPVTKAKGQSQGEMLSVLSIQIGNKGGNLYGVTSMTQKAAVANANQPIVLLKVSMPGLAGRFSIEEGASFARGSFSISSAKLVKDLEALGEP